MADLIGGRSLKDSGQKPEYKSLPIRLVVLLIVSVTAFSQPNVAPLRFEHLDLDTGFPDHTVNYLYQDKLGFLWAATTNGLARYNGREWRVWRHSIHESNSLSQNMTYALTQDQDGHIWVATAKGIDRMDRQGKSFHHIPPDSGGLRHQPSQVYKFLADGETMWHTSTIGLRQINTKTLQYINDGQPLLKDVFTFDINRADDGTLLISSREGFYYKKPGSNDFEKLQFDPKYKIENYITYQSFKHRTDYVVVADFGIFFFHPKRGVTEVYKHEKDNPKSAPAFAFGVTVDNDGLIWLMSQTRITLFDRDSGTFSINEHVEGSPNSLSGNSLTSILKDNSGLIWVGTLGFGLNRWDPLTRVFQSYRHIPNDKTSLSSTVPWKFLKTRDNQFYITTDAGLNRWNRQDNTFEHLNRDANPKYDLPNGRMFAIYEHDDGTIWIGSQRNIHIYNPETHEVQTLRGDEKNGHPAGLASFFLKGPDEAVWTSILFQGLYLIHPKHGLLESLKNNTTPGFHSENNMTNLVQRRDGAYWITTSNGLYLFNPKSKSLVRHYGPDQEQRLSHQNLSDILETPDGTIWVATLSGGLNKIQDDHVRFYTSREGLPDDTILTVEHDTRGFIWLSTNHGLVRLNPRNDTLRQFRPSHGLQSYEFNEGSSYKDKDGNLYFGGGKGFSTFNPELIKPSTFVPPVYITSIKTFNRPIEFDRLYAQIEDISLDWEEGFISFEFTALDYADPENNRFRYKMEGYSDEWIELGTVNRETFTLKPGSYTFKVQGSNRDGLFNDEPTSLRVTVITPPWQRNEAFALYILLIGLILYIYQRSRKAKRQQRRLAHLALKNSEERLKNALWGTGDELWEWDIKKDEVIRSNILDIRREKHKKIENVYNIMHPEDVEQVKEAIRQHLEGHRSYYEASYRISSPGGEWTWILDRGRVIERDENGKPLRLAGTNKNIHAIKSTEEQLQLIARAFENTSDAVIILDPQFKILKINQAYIQTTGCREEETLGYIFRPVTEKGFDTKLEILIKEALLATGHWQGELWQRHKNGSLFPVSVHLDVVKDTKGNVTHHVCIMSDITFVKQAEEKLRNLANFDQLTGLPNRNLFHDRLEHALNLAQRDKHKVALLFLDLDRFKNINDSLGHAAGDQLLKDVAVRVKSTLREVDSISRLGGDEFTIIIEGINTLKEITTVAEKLLQKLNNPFNLSGTEVVVTPSVGISLFPDDGDDCETLLKCADTAMYHAKREGRNNFQFFADEMNHQVVERLNLETEMRRALERNEFIVHYQPKFATSNSKIMGLEALVRWEHPDKGMISPGKFIPIAEETGLIIQLGHEVLRQACRQASTWLHSGLGGAKVAINLSAHQFRQTDLVEQIKQVLRDENLPPEYLELEITESTLMNNIESAISILLELKQLGLSLSLDDFGTGFSSLSYLKRLPIDALKIDRSFVSDVTEDADDAAIVTTIIDLAHNLNISVIAEGVETEEQFRFLEEKGCQQIQGFLLGRPLPASETEKVLTIHST